MIFFIPLCTYKVCISFKDGDGEKHTESVKIEQFEWGLLSSYNSAYLFDFTKKHPIIAKNVTVLAGAIDPRVGYTEDGSSEAMEKSIVGSFIDVLDGNISENLKGRKLKKVKNQNYKYGKAFRHLVYQGLLTDMYGADMAKKIGTYNEGGAFRIWNF